MGEGISRGDRNSAVSTAYKDGGFEMGKGKEKKGRRGEEGEGRRGMGEEGEGEMYILSADLTCDLGNITWT